MSKLFIGTSFAKPKLNYLTADKIEKSMSFIKPGDIIHFNSYKECYNSTQLYRHHNTIPATGEVIENCGGYLMLKLQRGVIESVNYFDIFAVNGIRFHGYSNVE